MDTPTTEAGRALLFGIHGKESMRDAILAIEDEAAAPAEARLALVVEIAERYHSGHSIAGRPCQCDLCRELRAFLAPPKEPKP